MKTIISISEARKRLPGIIKSLRTAPDTVYQVTVHDEVVAEIRTSPLVKPGAAAEGLLKLRIKWGNKRASKKYPSRSGLAAGQTCLRVRLIGQDNKIIDSFVQNLDSSGVSAKETKRFRLAAETPARFGEIKKAEVAVERVRAKGRWD